MSKELTLKVTDLERKAIAFCREKEIAFPIANHLVDFAQKGTELLSKHILELQADKGRLTDENRQAKEIIKTFCGLCDVFNSSNGSFDIFIAKAEAFLKE